MASFSQLDQLVSYFAGGNKAEFARMLGITKQSLNTWYNHEYLDIKKVFYACPGVSAEWLITGEGEMLTANRPPVAQQGDKQIPLIHEEDLLQGKWDESDSFILVRGDKQIDYDFITRLPNRDLEEYIYAGSLLGCTIINGGELSTSCLYILRTKNQGTFFVSYQGKEDKSESPIYKFTTLRTCQEPNIQLAIPTGDIIQCAEINVYSVDHFNDNII